MYKIILVLITVSPILSYISSDAVGANGMVVSSKIDASKIGIDILKKGGNAIDAAVAVGFALSVTHSGAGNLGGGGFAVIRLADGTVTTIDFRETAPLLSKKEMYLDENGNVIPGLSWSSSLSAGVPGTVAGLGYIHEKYGSMSWETLVYPSVFLAKYGFELDYHSVSVLNSPKYKSKLSYDKESKKIFTKDNNFKIGDIFIQEDLSNTLSRIAKYGYKEFYYGETSDLIINCMNRVNGIISIEDLHSYEVIEKEPIHGTYRGYNIYSMPPSSSGGITLINILNQIENIDINSLGFHSSAHVHYLVEAEKRAYADRAVYLGDTQYVDVPIDFLISKDYAKDRFEEINHSYATDGSLIYETNLSATEESEETTHFSIIDSFGNAVSITTTLNGWYGNGITVDNAGFLLNNEMDDFSIKPGYPNAYGLVGSNANSIEPGKRMLSSMTPTIVETSENDIYLVLGSPGGSTIITTVAQIISNVIDFSMDIDQAVESKRFHHQCLPDKIQLEMFSLPTDVINKLSLMNHDYIYRSRLGIGEANCIMNVDGFYYGAADSRRDSKAIAY